MQTLLNVACVPALLCGLIFIRGRGLALKAGWLMLFGAFALYKAAGVAAIAFRELAQPPLWDFKVFWMIGQICAAGHNIYNVASYQPFRAVLNPANDPEFNSIALQIGMPYPPPAVALFCPLGHFANLQTAMVAWYSVLFVSIVVSIIVLWRQFLADEGLAGLIAAAVLVLTLPGTTMTVAFGQLNFFALLLLAGMWRQRLPGRFGVWLAPLLVLRPLCLLFAVYFAARRHWSALLAVAVTSGLLLLLSAPIIGVSGFVAYLHQNPTQRYPLIYFKGWESLYKILVTSTQDYDGFFSLAGHPFFVLISVVLIIAAAYVCVQAGDHQRNTCLSMLLALGLFLYPNSGSHYSVLLLVPMLSLWCERKRIGLSDVTLVAFFTLQYTLFIFRDGSLTTGLVFGMDAVVFAIVSLRLPRRSVVRPIGAVVAPT